MKPVWMDFAAPNGPPQHWHRWVVLMVLILLFALSTHWVLERKLSETTHTIRHLEESVRLSTAENAVPISPISQTKGITKERLETLLTSLEITLDDSITLLNLSPRLEEIDLIGEAKDLAAVTAFVKRMQMIPFLATIHLTETHAVAEHPQHPVRFSLHAQWKLVP